MTQGIAITTTPASRRAVVDDAHRLLPEVGDRHRQRLLGRIGQHDQRREELVPGGEEGEQPDRDQPRHHRRQHDAPQHVEGAAAVDQRRFLEVARDRLERDAHHVGGERQLEHRDDERHAEQRIGEADAVEQHVERDDQRRERHHQDRQRQQEQDVPAPELEAREGVAAERRDRRA